MKYVMLFCANEDEWSALPDGERDSAVAAIGAWFGEYARAGKIVEGRRLFGRDRARTVRLGPAGKSRQPAVVDGPFSEAKEVIGSYAVVEAADESEALAIAQAWPGGGVIEIRPVMEG